MPININPNAQSSGLAQAAALQATNLGLRPVGSEYRERMQLELNALFKQKEMEYQYKALDQQKQLAELTEKGLLSRQEASQAWQAAQQDLRQKFEAEQNQIKNAIEMQQNQATQQYQQGLLANQQMQLQQEGLFKGAELGLKQQEMGMNQDYRMQELGIRKDEAQASKEYMKGLVDVQKGKLSLEQEAAEQEKIFKVFDRLDKAKTEELQLLGKVGGAIAQNFAYYGNNPEQLQQANNFIYDQAIKLGASEKDINELKKLPLEQQALRAQGAMALYQMGTEIKKAKGEAKTAIVPAVDANGQPTFQMQNTAPNKYQETKMKEEGKLSAAFPDKMREITSYVDEIKVARDLVKSAGEGIFGPVNGIFSEKASPKAKAIAGALARLTLRYKNVAEMGSQGFTERDKEFVEFVHGNLKTYKGTLIELLDMAENFARNDAGRQWMAENDRQKRNLPQAEYEQWKRNTPEPELYVQNSKNGDGIAMPVSEYYKKEQAIAKAGWKLI